MLRQYPNVSGNLNRSEQTAQQTRTNEPLMIRLLTTTISILLFSCNATTNNSANGQVMDNLKHSVIKEYNVHTTPEIYETAFFKNTVVKKDSINFKFYSVDIGNIQVESGKLIACDPIVMKDGIAFTQKFPIGQFPVQLAIAKRDSDERVAFSRILFSNDTVTMWEFALQPGQKQKPITGDDIYCYGVSAGTGLFIDEQANKIFQQKDFSVWEHVFVKDIEKNYRNTWSYVVHEFDGHNLTAFSTGYGDGCYATYIGFNSKGEVCRLLTDFGIVQWWKQK